MTWPRGAYLISICALYFLTISFLVIRFDIGYITSMFLYFAVPSVYFSFVNPAAIPKNLFYAFSFSVPTTVVLDYIAHVSKTWYVPSFFSIRILDAFPAEEIIWAFLFYYVILACYNGICKEGFDPTIRSRNNKYILLIILLIVPAFFLALLLDKQLLVIRHFYILMVMFMMVIPTAAVLYFRPYLFKKIGVLTLVFAGFFLLFYEYAAVKTGQWIFFEDYIGWIKLFDVRFPVEELLFAFFAVPGTIGLYEFFSDGKQKA